MQTISLSDLCIGFISTGSAFDESRVFTKCPQEGNGVKRSICELATPKVSNFTETN